MRSNETDLKLVHWRNDLARKILHQEGVKTAKKGAGLKPRKGLWELNHGQERVENLGKMDHIRGTLHFAKKGVEIPGRIWDENSNH